MNHSTPRFFAILLACLFVVSATVAAQDAPTDEAIAQAVKSVQSVDLHGVGHPKAVEAMQVLNRISADQVPMLFEAMDGCNQLAANWIRAAAQKAISNSTSIPLDKLLAYFEEKSNDPLGRWLAYQILVDNKKGFGEQRIETLVDDPSMPLREMGIHHLIKQASSIEVGEGDEAAKKKKLAVLDKAFMNARDVEQVQSIAKLSAKLGKEIKLQEHLGFISTWKMIGGFENKDESGFNVAYAPEKNLSNVDTSANVEIGEEKVDWLETTSEHETGLVDLNKLIGQKKGVIGYAVGGFDSPIEGAAEIRIGTPNAHKIWVNGTLVMENEIYHNSNSIDKFSAPLQLKKGDNKIVVKLCQNEQTQSWAQGWSFQIRICDETGKAIQ